MGASTKIVATGRVFQIGELLEKPKNGDIRILEPREKDLLQAKLTLDEEEVAYNYARAKVYICGEWVRMSFTTWKGIQAWYTHEAYYTNKRMGLFAAFLGLMRGSVARFDNTGVFFEFDRTLVESIETVAWELRQKWKSPETTNKTT